MKIDLYTVEKENQVEDILKTVPAYLDETQQLKK